MKIDDKERVYLNRTLAMRFPFLFEGLDPDRQNVEFAPILMFEHNKIENKRSELPSAQRKVITDYVQAFKAHKDNPKKD